MRLTEAALVLAVVLSAGCGDYEMAPSDRRSAAPEAVGVAVDPFSPAPPAGGSAAEAPQAAPTPVEPKPAAPATSQTPASQPPAQQAAPGSQAPGYQPPMSYQPQRPPEETIREKAEVGMGRKGHYSPGILTTPLASYWRSQELAAYRIKVPHALNLYKGLHGQFPKTQEEFVREILEPNQIKLPELPEGHFYVYDPEKGELQVARPK
jgi:hypothetical protein